MRPYFVSNCLRLSYMQNRLHWTSCCCSRLSLGGVGGWQRFCVMVLHALLLVVRAAKGGLSTKSHFLFLHSEKYTHMRTRYAKNGVRSHGSGGPFNWFDYTCLFWREANASCVHKYQNMELNRISVWSMPLTKYIGKGIIFSIDGVCDGDFSTEPKPHDIKCILFSFFSLSFFD